MKNIFRKTPNWIFVSFFLLITASCNSVPDPNAHVYDIENYRSKPSFAIAGKVTDIDNNPIENIKVFIRGNDKKTLTYTNAKGEFSVFFRNFKCIYYEISTLDVDGKEYGGEFEDQTLHVIFEENNLYENWTKKTVDITLELKGPIEE